MTGPEHYRKAEELAVPGARDADGSPFESDADRLAAAQVHATLALAAATSTVDEDNDWAWGEALAGRDPL
jgi:hypothetical protein